MGWTAGSRNCSRDRLQQSNHRLTSGIIHGGIPVPHGLFFNPEEKICKNVPGMYMVLLTVYGQISHEPKLN